MAFELTQWTLLRRRSLDGVVRPSDLFLIKPPGGDPRPCSLACLPKDVSEEVRALASGSKIPKHLLERILRAEEERAAAAGERALPQPPLEISS